MQSTIDALNNVWLGDHSIQLCNRCVDLSGMRSTHLCEPIDNPRYMTMCVVCYALPPMKLIECYECGQADVHPYDQNHAEGWCKE